MEQRTARRARGSGGAVSRSDLEGGAFTLTIESDDWWKPDYFAVFGVDTVNAGPRVRSLLAAGGIPAGPHKTSVKSE